MDGGDGGGALSGDGMGGKPGGGYANDDDSPCSFEEIERPPLRHIDKYLKAECPCLSTRYTIALMTCLGFIISFGMRCNMGMAKLKLFGAVSFFFIFRRCHKMYEKRSVTLA
jgi:hypothetical protein